MSSKRTRDEKISSAYTAMHLALEKLEALIANARRNLTVVCDEEVQGAATTSQRASMGASVAVDLLSAKHVLENLWASRELAPIAGYSPDAVPGKAKKAVALGIEHLEYIPRESSRKQDGEDEEDEVATGLLAAINKAAQQA